MSPHGHLPALPWQCQRQEWGVDPARAAPGSVWSQEPGDALGFQHQTQPAGRAEVSSSLGPAEIPPGACGAFPEVQGVMAVEDVSLHTLTWTCWWHLFVFQKFTKLSCGRI